VSATGQLAARAIGSEVGFAKSFLTAEAFRPLPGPRRVVLAGDARLGLASGFPRTLTAVDAAGAPLVTVVDDLPASERFYAGGDTTVRGFPLDTLGTAKTIDKDGFPIGGNALVIFNGELRVPVRGGFGLVGFLDAGNVFAQASDIDLTELRTAAGFGIRYKSPVGPIRIDFGFKLRRHEIVPGQLEGRSQIYVSLGQAF
jgi:outer membrane translocation and assembly module TamA